MKRLSLLLVGLAILADVLLTSGAAVAAGTPQLKVAIMGSWGSASVPRETAPILVAQDGELLYEPLERVSPFNLRIREGGKGHMLGYPYKGVFTGIPVALRRTLRGMLIDGGFNGSFAGEHTFEASLPGWVGMWDAWNRVLAAAGGTLDVLVVLPFHNCLPPYVDHVQGEWTCDLGSYVAFAQGLVRDAKSRGIKVIQVGYPDFDDLNLRLMAQIYGMDPTKLPDREEYNFLRTIWQFGLEPLVDEFILPYAPGRVRPPDGWNPDPATDRRIAVRIKEIILREPSLGAREAASAPATLLAPLGEEE